MQPSTIIARHPSPILKQKGTGRMAKPDPTEAKLRGVQVLDGPTPHHLFGYTPIRKGIRSGWEGAPSGEFRSEAWRLVITLRLIARPCTLPV